MLRKTALCTLVLALLAPTLVAQSAQDPCSFKGTVQDYINSLLERLDDPEVEEEVAKVQCPRADSDGLGTGPIDLLCRAFVALDLGEVSEEEGTLVFNFNPEFMKLPVVGQFSPRVVIHEPSVWEALSKQLDTLPESLRQDRKDGLSKGLEDLDDVELQVRWNYQGQPDGGKIEELARVLFEDAYQKLRKETSLVLGEHLADLQQRARLVGVEEDPLTMKTVCASEELKSRIEDIAPEIETEVPKFLAAFHESLTNEDYFQLADLYEGQPQIVAQGTFRNRQGATGPDQWSLSVRGEMGAVSYWGWKRWAGGNFTSASLHQYLAEHEASSLPLFVVKAEYKDTSPLHFSLPADNFTYDLKGSKVGSASAQLGTYLFGSRTSRLDLETKYDFTSDDEVTNDRFVGTLTWTQALSGELAKIAGGTELAVSLVYADKPEFRGEVDEELSLRAGLKWSISGN